MLHFVKRLGENYGVFIFFFAFFFLYGIDSEKNDFMLSG